MLHNKSLLVSVAILVIGLTEFTRSELDIFGEDDNWKDFTGGCLHPPSLNDHDVLVFECPSDVLSAIAQYKKDQLGGSCGPEFRDAFERLEWVLDEQTVLKDSCGLEAYERIRAFHLEFIHYYVPELSRDQLLRLRLVDDTTSEPLSLEGEAPAAANNRWPLNIFANKNNQNNQNNNQLHYKLKPIPPALRQFFINFVKQINTNCKQQLVHRFESLVNDKKLVDEHDFEIMDLYKKQEHRLDFLHELAKAGVNSYEGSDKYLLNEIEMLDLKRQPNLPKTRATIRYNNPVSSGISNENNNKEELPVINVKLRSQEMTLTREPDDGLKLYLQVPYDDHLKKIKTACVRRLMPIYQELFAPIIRLNNLGYIDRSEGSEKFDEKLREQRFAKWLINIQICEVLKDIEVYHDTSEKSVLLSLVLGESHLLERNRPYINPEHDTACLLGDKIRLLSREEALELAKSQSVGGQVESGYNPPEARVPHERVEFVNRMWLLRRAKVVKQVYQFDREIPRLIGRKTSVMRMVMDEIKVNLKRIFITGQRQVKEKDPKSQLGKMAIFLERHHVQIRCFGILMSMIMLSLMIVL